MARPARPKMPSWRVQRQMILVLGHQHLGQQPGGGIPLIDHVGGHRACAGVSCTGHAHLPPDVALDAEGAGGVVRFSATILADAAHLAATGWVVESGS